MRLPAALLLLVTLALAGCSGAGSEADAGDEGQPGGSGTGSSGPGSASATQTAMPTAPQTHEVTLSGNEFDPADLSIRAGDTVRWTHRDGLVPHNVEAEDGSFDSHPNCTVGVPASPLCMQDGQTFQYVFATVGNVTVLCEIHPNMVSTITVA